MATRYSGNATIRIVYNDGTAPNARQREPHYECKLAIDGRHVWDGEVGPPASGYGDGVELASPRAYDCAARAALSFATEELAGSDVDLQLELDGEEPVARRARVARVAAASPRVGRMPSEPSPDLRFLPGASFSHVVPSTPRAFAWVRENVHVESWQWQGEAFVCEGRQAVDLAAHATDAGLLVDWGTP